MKNALLIQGTILHSLWNYIPDFPVSQADDITISRYVFNAAVENYEIAETLPAAGLQEKSSKLILTSRVCRDWLKPHYENN